MSWGRAKIPPCALDVVLVILPFDMSEPFSPEQIKALIRLLDDDDVNVTDHVQTQLRTAGPAAAPYLEAASSDHPVPTIRRASRGLLDRIRSDEIEHQWVTLQTAPDGNALEEGAFLLERLIHPDRIAEQQRARAELELLSAGAREAVSAHADIAVRVDELRRYIHETSRFRGNTENYYDPENSFLSQVLSRRTGIPITLALVYLSLAHRIGIPLVGVSMPMHFLVGYQLDSAYRYLDPFFDGREVSRGECMVLLERAGFDPVDDYMKPAPVVATLERMAKNLIVIYQHTAHERELKLARRFVTLLTGETES